jgi:hypothetical protein
MGSWIDQELAGSRIAGARLGKQFALIVEQLSTGLGRTLPLACEDRAGNKAGFAFSTTIA